MLFLDDQVQASDGNVFWCASGLRLRGIGPALAGKLGGGWSFGAARWRRFDRFLCLLRLDPAAAGCHGVSQASPWGALTSGVDLGFGESWGLVPGFGLGLRGIGPALAGKLGGGWGFRAARWGRFDRFLCLLRPEPAAAGYHGMSLLRKEGQLDSECFR